MQHQFFSPRDHSFWIWVGRRGLLILSNKWNIPQTYITWIFKNNNMSIIQWFEDVIANCLHIDSKFWKVMKIIKFCNFWSLSNYLYSNIKTSKASVYKSCYVHICSRCMTNQHGILLHRTRSASIQICNLPSSQKLVTFWHCNSTDPVQGQGPLSPPSKPYTLNVFNARLIFINWNHVHS